MINLVPCGHRVLVSLKELEEKSEGGIIVNYGHTGAREQRSMREATVVAIGNNAFKAFDDGHDWCSVGDKVMVVRYSGEDFTDEETGTIYRIINDEDILALVKEENHD